MTENKTPLELLKDEADETIGSVLTQSEREHLRCLLVRAFDLGVAAMNDLAAESAPADVKEG